MQVAHATVSNDVAVIGGGATIKMSIAQSAHAFRVVSKALYSFPELACAREVICNALDAHARAGKSDVPVKVTLTETAFIVEDEGNGIAPDRMGPLYLTMFGTDKVDLQNEIGGFGLGCKAPFAVSDHFTVTSRHQGVQTIYSVTMYDEETGEPGAKPMASGRTTKTGLIVNVPVAKERLREFRKSVDKIVREGGLNVTINGQPVPKARDYSKLASAGFGLFKDDEEGHRYHANSAPQVYLGGVLYPLSGDHKDISPLLSEIYSWNHQQNHMRLIVYAPPSSISPTPSREALLYDEHTVATLVKLLTKVTKTVKAEMIAARTELFDKGLADYRRHNFAQFFTGEGQRNIKPMTKPTHAVGAKRIASYLVAHCGHGTFSMYGGLGRKWLTRAANTFRHNRKSLIIAANDGNIGADMRRHYLRRVERAVRPIIEAKSHLKVLPLLDQFETSPDVYLRGRLSVKKPEGYRRSNLETFPVLFRASIKARLRTFNTIITDPDFKSGRTVITTALGDCESLTLAPTREAAIISEHTGAFVITRGLKPEQIEAVKAAALRQNLKLNEVGRAVKEKRATKDATEIDNGKFHTWPENEAKKYNRRTYERRMVFSEATLEKPAAYLPLMLTRFKETVQVVVPQQGGYGPIRPYSEDRFKYGIETELLSKMKNFFPDRKDLAIPSSKAERNRLEEAGVPRLIRVLLDELHELAKDNSEEAAFTAAVAIGSMHKSLYRHNSYGADNERAEFALGLAHHSRQMACAVLLQPYTPSKELDRAFVAWRNVSDFFDRFNKPSFWLDEGEAIIIEEAHEEFRELIDKLDASTSQEMAAFLKRLRTQQLKLSDVAHLEFVAEMFRSDSIPKGFEDRLMEILAEEGRRYLEKPTNASLKGSRHDHSIVLR